VILLLILNDVWRIRGGKKNSKRKIKNSLANPIQD
jgi:hypothetical protein